MNLGYCCINTELSKKKITTNRSCIKKTYKNKGIEYVSELALKNISDLPTIIEWNHKNNIKLFRLSSEIFPWLSDYNIEELPDYEAIKEKLEYCGKLAQKYNQRLTLHPSHFNVLCSLKQSVVDNTIHELNFHGKMFDLMNLEQTPYNKINIHIGSTQGGKPRCLDKFKENFQLLSPSVQKRLTIENDDKPNSYSVDDLLPLAKSLNIPIVYDIHHQRFCKGKLSDLDALKAAVSTWNDNIIPVVHLSESQEGRKLNAHSDYITKYNDYHGYDTSKLMIQIEAKMKEKALLHYRDNVIVQYGI